MHDPTASGLIGGHLAEKRRSMGSPTRVAANNDRRTLWPHDEGKSEVARFGFLPIDHRKCHG